MYKIVDGLVIVPTTPLEPASGHSRVNHQFKYWSIWMHSDTSKFSYFPMTIPEWNNLNLDAVHQSTSSRLEWLSHSRVQPASPWALYPSWDLSTDSHSQMQMQMWMQMQIQLPWKRGSKQRSLHPHLLPVGTCGYDLISSHPTLISAAQRTAALTHFPKPPFVATDHRLYQPWIWPDRQAWNIAIQRLGCPMSDSCFNQWDFS